MTTTTRTALTCLLALAFHAPVQATKFQLGNKEEAQKTVGNADGRVIEGVILEESKDSYKIRVVGGEITIAKSQVVSTSDDGLTVAKIEAMEKDSAAQVAAAETRRREVQTAEASVRRQAPPAPATEPEKTMVIEVDFQGLLPGYTFRTYDPVLRRANLTGLRQVIENYLRTEVRDAAHRR